jgi:hypothetical protein
MAWLLGPGSALGSSRRALAAATEAMLAAGAGLVKAPPRSNPRSPLRLQGNRLPARATALKNV